MKSFKLLTVAFLCLLSSKSFSQHAFEWSGMSPYFDNGVSDLVAYIDFGEIALWGSVEVSLTASFSHSNSTGLYRKSYDIGRNIGAFYSNAGEVSSALGPVAAQWKLGDFEVNSANHLVIPIYHLVPTGNSIVISIKGIAVIPIDVNLISITTPVVLAGNQKRDYNYINGKLSVGTSKADDDALLTVAGNIKSREIKVKIDAGADFVFDDAYKLPRLDSIEHFVNLNSHLPDIPSASEMKTSGLDVGNFQIKLLQKIEELTLHLIEQHRSIKELQQENKVLTIEVQKIKSKPIR